MEKGVMNPERGILNGFAKGKRTMPGPGKMPLLLVIARSAATKQSQKGSLK
ncbi:MAG: hypothetical protein WB564_07770 [Dehalococcoidia bacterium]